MTHLTLGLGFLRSMAMARGPVEFSLADRLPPNLEYLCIRGYKKGKNELSDRDIGDLVTRFEDGRLPLLTELIGVDECITNAQYGSDLDRDDYYDLPVNDEEDWSGYKV